jgi:hypothetical protein
MGAICWFPLLGGYGVDYGYRSASWVNTCACVLHLACGCLGQHDGCRSSCYLSKSKTKTKSVKVIWNEIDSFFRMNCWRLTKRTGHYAWPRTCCSSRPCRCVEGNHGTNHLDDDSRIVNHCSRVSCFDCSRDVYDCDVDGSLTHCYV